MIAQKGSMTDYLHVRTDVAGFWLFTVFCLGLILGGLVVLTFQYQTAPSYIVYPLADDPPKAEPFRG